MSKFKIFFFVLLAGFAVLALTSQTAFAANEKGPRCSDGIDNDNDGLIDSSDPDCGGDGGGTDLETRVIELEAQVATLMDLLQYVRVQDDEINGLLGPHFIIEGANVHIRSGSGNTWENCQNTDTDFTPDCQTVTGLGNLIVGYNENRYGETGTVPEYFESRSGSHNLVVGSRNSFTAWGSIVAGHRNTTSSSFTAVIGGRWNEASGFLSSVLGGRDGLASGEVSTVTGGSHGTAPSLASSVGGGQNNTASGEYSIVMGGAGNDSFGLNSVIAGGIGSETTGNTSSVFGGYLNTASGEYSTAMGGNQNEAAGRWSTVSGGLYRDALGIYDWAAGNYWADQ
jgi:hypothetical protein